MMLLNGCCLEQMKTLPDNSVDAIVTDPPYGLSFMGKKWDYDVPSKEIWSEALRVLKPGGHLLSFAGTRTYHRMAVNIEDAGFEIRDQIMWLYGSGFPKSHNIGKAIDKMNGVELEVTGKGRSGSNSRAYQSEDKTTAGEYQETKSNNEWSGFGTALKPANEPIVVARKPLEKGLTVAQNVLKWGTGALNIDGSRIESKPRKTGTKSFDDESTGSGSSLVGSSLTRQQAYDLKDQGRWPSNVILDEEAAQVLDEQSGHLKNGGQNKTSIKGKGMFLGDGSESGTSNFAGDSGGSSRFFKVISAQKDAIETAWKTTNANSAELNLKTTQEIELNEQTHFVLRNVMQFLDSVNHFLSVKSVEISAQSIEPDFALEVARMLNRKDQSLLPCQDYTLDSKNSTLIQNLVFLAETSENIDIIQTIQSLLKLCGCALPVTEKNIISGKKDLNSKFVPTRFLYQAKASKRERGEFNGHPTVKPIRLMEYLINLVTPPNGTVLDPFMGSGSTGVAAKNLGFKFIGIERELEYFEICRKRISE